MTVTEEEKERNRSVIVLAIDDAAENIALLKAILTASGYQFFGAGNGQDGLDIAFRVQPRVVLLDIEMKNLNGYDTCRRLRQIPHMDDIPIIFVTSRKTGQDVKDGITAGGDDFVIKPYDRAQLLARVKQWSTQRHQVRQPAAKTPPKR